MKLSTSTGDFSGYARGGVAEKVKCFKGTKFKYINLEQSASDEYFEDSDGYRSLIEKFAEAAEYAGIKYVTAHAPCVNAFEELTDEHYQINVRALRRSIEIAGAIGIGTLVVHASTNPAFDYPEFVRQNKRFYGDLMADAEKYGVTLLTENMHDMPYISFSTGEEMRAFLDELDHPLLGACYDTAHTNLNERARGIGQYNNIVALGHHLKGLHISDNLGGTAHHHSWPFAGIINFDEVMLGLLDVKYGGYFNFEASYTLLHQSNPPKRRRDFTYGGERVTKLLNPSIELKRKATDLLFDIGEHILRSYDCFEE